MLQWLSQTTCNIPSFTSQLLDICSLTFLNAPLLVDSLKLEREMVFPSFSALLVLTVGGWGVVTVALAF